MRDVVTRLVSIPALIAALFGAACASGPGSIEAPSETGAMLYGSVELPAEVRDEIQWLIVYKVGEVYAPPFKSPIKARVFPNGDFYMENVSPGQYFVHDVVANFEGFYLYPPSMSDAKDVALKHAVDVAPGSVTYLGRYRIHQWKPGVQSKLSPQVGSVRFLSNPPGAGSSPLPNFMNQQSALAPGAGMFSLEFTRSKKDEQRVLRAILGEVKGTGWDARVEKKLATLR
ncbi:MAG TPA: hypothetical protein VFY49_04515 [Myxococcota bacterium]|nr:hypothetical protein [Myxococcota bacterium]